jgi:hypothetical protein
LLFLQRLDPIPDQRASSQTEAGAHPSPDARMANSGADGTADGGAAHRADGSAFLTRGERLGATHKSAEQNHCYDSKKPRFHCLYLLH